MRKNIVIRKHLSLFRMWLRKQGWALFNPEYPWQVFIAIKSDKTNPLIVYKTSSFKRFRVDSTHSEVFSEFMKWVKESYEND